MVELMGEEEVQSRFAPLLEAARLTFVEGETPEERMERWANAFLAALEPLSLDWYSLSGSEPQPIFGSSNVGEWIPYDGSLSYRFASTKARKIMGALFDLDAENLAKQLLQLAELEDDQVETVRCRMRTAIERHAIPDALKRLPACQQLEVLKGLVRDLETIGRRDFRAALTPLIEFLRERDLGAWLYRRMNGASLSGCNYPPPGCDAVIDRTVWILQFINLLSDKPQAVAEFESFVAGLILCEDSFEAYHRALGRPTLAILEHAVHDKYARPEEYAVRQQEGLDIIDRRKCWQEIHDPEGWRKMKELEDAMARGCVLEPLRPAQARDGRTPDADPPFQCPTPPTSVTAIETPLVESSEAPPPATVNMKMLERLHSDNSVIGWPAQKWADELGCVKSTVAATQAWKVIRGARAVSRAGLPTYGDGEGSLKRRR